MAVIMYFRRSSRRYKDRTYHSFQLVSTHRHPETRRPTTKVHASLGDLSKLKEEDRTALVVSLARALGVMNLMGFSDEELEAADMNAVTARTQSIGVMWACLGILEQIRLPQAWQRIVTKRKNAKTLALHLTALICHRIDRPGSKLSILRWLKKVFIPGIDKCDVTYQGLLRTMDILLEHKSEIERALADRLLTMFDTELDLVLMDATSVSVCTEASEHELFAHGYSRDGHPERKQYVLMLVTTKDGVPIYHDVHPGNSVDVKLVEETITQVREIFPQVDRCMVVGDRGMLSEDNVMALSEAGFEHLIAAPLKREMKIREVIKQTHDELVAKANDLLSSAAEEEPIKDVMTEADADGERVVVVYSMQIAQTQRQHRHAKIQSFLELVDRTTDQVEGRKGARLDDEGALKRLVAQSVKRKVTAYFHIYRSEDGLFRVDDLEDVMTYADQCDGKLALSTNNKTLTPEELNSTYRDLQEVERSFRTLKSFLKIRPTYHWAENRVRAHVLVCVLSLVVERVMRLRLKAAGSSFSPAAALEELSNLTRVSLTLPSGEKRQLLANSSPVQMDLFKSLEVIPLTNSRLNKLTP